MRSWWPLHNRGAGLETSIMLSSNDQTVGNGEVLHLNVEAGASARVSFAGEGAPATGSRIASYDWDLDGESIREASFHRDLSPGNHEVVLTVTDNGSVQGAASTQIIVRVAKLASVPGELSGS
jgi:hypothetical protein